MTWPPPRPPWWVAVVAVGIAVAAIVWALNRGRAASRELAREREERALEVAGLNVAHQTERGELLAGLIAEAEKSAALAEELARIQTAAPGARPVATAHGSTGRIPVGPAAGTTAPSSPPAAGVADPPPVPASPSCPPCRLVAGDGLEIRASGAALETRAGNVVVGAVASAWRHPAEGGEPERLVEGPLKLEVQVQEAARAPGWGAGAVVVGGRSGWWVGPLLAPPPLRLFGMEAALLVGAGVGGAGEWGGLAGGLVRW